MVVEKGMDPLPLSIQGSAAVRLLELIKPKVGGLEGWAAAVLAPLTCLGVAQLRGCRAQPAAAGISGGLGLRADGASAAVCAVLLPHRAAARRGLTLAATLPTPAPCCWPAQVEVLTSTLAEAKLNKSITVPELLGPAVDVAVCVADAVAGLSMADTYVSGPPAGGCMLQAGLGWWWAARG